MDLVSVEDIVTQHGSQKNALIAILQDLQAEYTYLPKEALEHLALRLDIPLSRAYSLATFYRAFSLRPKGRYPVAICMGTACHVKAAVKVLEKFERELGIRSGGTTPDLTFGLEEVRCLGCCGLAPVVTVGQDIYSKVSLPRVDQIIKKYLKEAPQDAKAKP